MQLKRPLAPTFIPPSTSMTRRQTIVSACLLFLAAISLLFLLTTPTTSFSVAPGSTTSRVLIGRLVFSNSNLLDPSSQHGLNDIVTLDLGDLRPPIENMALYAWLLPETTHAERVPRLLGRLSPDSSGSAHLLYQAPQQQNLLAIYSRFLLTQEPVAPVPITPSLDPHRWQASGELMDVSLPAGEKSSSLLSHLRHLLAEEQTLTEVGLGGGLSIWLSRNSQKLLEWATGARDLWGDPNTDLMHRQIIRILQYLDGTASTSDVLPPDTPILVDPRAGRLGLLGGRTQQSPTGYLSHISLHLTGLAHAPGVTQAQTSRAIKLDTAIHLLRGTLQQMRRNAVELVNMSDADLRQRKALHLLGSLVTHANTAYVGHIDPATGISQGGTVWIASQLQLFAEIPITVSLT